MGHEHARKHTETHTNALVHTHTSTSITGDVRCTSKGERESRPFSDKKFSSHPFVAAPRREAADTGSDAGSVDRVADGWRD